MYVTLGDNGCVNSALVMLLSEFYAIEEISLGHLKMLIQEISFKILNDSSVLVINSSQGNVFC